MRDALRQAVMEMRAAQDQSAQAQSDLAKSQADKTALQAQLDAANAKLAEQSSKPVAAPADTGLQDRLRAAEAQSTALQQRSAQLQSSYQTAAQLARSKDDESRAAQTALTSQTAALVTCKATNAKLIGVSEQILHLYQTPDFRGLLLKSNEPVLGLWRVKLENMVQDYDDKIQDQEYIPAAAARRK